jgi:hypothetical protein
MQIENKHIAELAQVLASRAGPTTAEILEAMALAYNAGRNDGAVDALNSLQKTWSVSA